MREMESVSPTVGIVIIGDEILKGHISDANSYFLCKEFYSLGIKVGRVTVVADSVEEIASEVSRASADYSYVVTTGGVGLTHDDVTYEGVAKAVGEELNLNEQMLKYYWSYCCGGDGCSKVRIGRECDLVKNPQLRIACVPRASQIIFIPTTSGAEPFRTWQTYPVVKVRNVFILPGVPELAKLCFKEISQLYFRDSSSTRFHNRSIYLSRNERFILAALNEAVSRFSGTVVFGSYPVMDSPVYATKLSIESTDERETTQAEEFLKSRILQDDPDCLVEGVIARAAVEVYKIAQLDMTVLRDHGFPARLDRSIKVVEEAFSKYNSESIFLNFNGGKDCTALLHLVTAVWQAKHSTHPPVQIVYFKHTDPFPEIEEFISETAKRYRVNVNTVPGPIKAGLTKLLESQTAWKACFMGTRRSDPFSDSLVHFQLTDENWPQVMRINPILDWTYEDVWTFLCSLSVPYCSLYDQGYTSLGSQNNTKRNPRLQYVDENGVEKFLPAYKLIDGSTERDGRTAAQIRRLFGICDD